jgi:twinkle protein
MAQGNFVDELKKISVRYNVAVILVAHPRKAGANDDDVFDNDAVSGSSDITNRVDIVLNYSRAKDTDEYDSRLQISKNRLAGALKLGKDAIPLNYSPHSKRVFGLRSLIKTYGWERQPITVEGIDVPF